MIIYTGAEEYLDSWFRDLKIKEIAIDDCTRLIVYEGDDDQVTVARLISTDPCQYLRPEFQPGSRLRLAYRFQPD